MQNRKTEYPKVGDTVQVTIGKADKVLTLAFYEVKKDLDDPPAGQHLEIEFFDIKLVTESDVPF